MSNNCGVFLRQRPDYKQAISADHFQIKAIPEPSPLADDEVLVETVNFSVDPVLVSCRYSR